MRFKNFRRQQFPSPRSGADEFAAVWTDVLEPLLRSTKIRLARKGLDAVLADLQCEVESAMANDVRTAHLVSRSADVARVLVRAVGSMVEGEPSEIMARVLSDIAALGGEVLPVTGAYARRRARRRR
jgi:hypothetical protein